MHQVTLKKIMSTDPIFATETDSVIDISLKMQEQKKSCAIVIKEGEPIGIVTERDIVSSVANYNQKKTLLNVKVKAIMTSPVLTLREGCKFVEGLILSRARRIRHIPVVNDKNQCTGLISFHDLSNAYIHLIEELHNIIENSVQLRTEKLEKTNEQLQALSLEDPMLGIGNRRSMKVDLKHTDASFSRYKTPYAVALFDLDYFKKYNDHYGHPAADKILKTVSKYLGEHIRATDRIYRYGGEEFLILMPETPSVGAKVIVNRLIEGIQSLNITHKASPFKKITISGGFCATDLSERIGHDLTSTEMVAIADKCLYQAKKNGRSTYGMFSEIEDFYKSAPRKYKAASAG